jgi:hypothetical protein
LHPSTPADVQGVRVPQVTVRRIVANVAAKSVAGVRRFYLRDPTGKLLNVLSHRH